MPVLLSTPSKFHNGQHRNNALYVFSKYYNVTAHFIEREQEEKILKGEKYNKDEFPLTARNLNIVHGYLFTCRLMTVFTPWYWQGHNTSWQMIKEAALEFISW